MEKFKINKEKEWQTYKKYWQDHSKRMVSPCKYTKEQLRDNFETYWNKEVVGNPNYEIVEEFLLTNFHQRVQGRMIRPERI